MMLARGLGARPFTAQRPAMASRSCLPVVCQAAAEKAPVKQKAYHPSPLSQKAPQTYAIVEIGVCQPEL